MRLTTYIVARAFGLALTLFACGRPSETRAPSTVGQNEFGLDPFSARTPIEKMVLPNGLTLLLNRDQRVPLVAVRVVYRVGWTADPPERSGLAHLTEHLLFHGSRRVEDGMHFRLLQGSGADSVNGATYPERTDLWELVPSSELALALWLESDRMSSGLEGVSEARLDKERRIIQRERAERIENVPNGRVDEIIKGFLFPPGHPFRAESVAGRALDGTKFEEVREFHRTHYAPGNALLILCGDFDVGNAKALVRHYFEPIAARPFAPIRNAPPVAPTPATIHLEARVDAASLVISWPSAPVFAPGDAELDVVASYLNYVALRPFVAQTPILSSVFAQQQSEARGSIFQISASLRTGVEPAAALAGLDSALEQTRQEGIDDGHVRRFADAWLYDLHVGSDDLLYRSWFIAHSELFSQGPDFMGRAIERYRMVTRATVREAIARYLSNDRRVVAFITPNRDAPISGRLAVRP